MSNSKIKPNRIHPYFKMIFWVVTGVTVLCLAVPFFLSLYSPVKEMTDVPALQRNLCELCESGFKLGLGAILGLLGGKVS